MPPDSVEQNQADFSGRYTPIDAPQYQQVQAQAYYERMRAHVNERSQSLMSGGRGRITTGSESAMGVATGGMYDPSRRSYRSARRQQRGDAQDITERAMQAPMNAMDAFGIFGSMMAVENPVEEAVGNALYRGAGSGGSLGYFGSSVAGMGAGAVAGTAALAAAEGAIQFTGTRDAFNQFEDIRNLQEVSRPMTAGTASGPRGRMSRSMAQNITADMAEQGRLSSMMKDGDTFGDMQEQAGILADHKLLEGVRNADEFERKFGELKEGVKRVMEVLGTTFEEGAGLLEDFRNVGVTPGTGVNLLNEAKQTSAQFGTNFRQTHAAGMKSAMAMQGTGMSMAAGYQMGQQTQGMAQTIYEGRYLDEQTMYNMGGQQGIRMNLQRGQMRFMESAPFTAMMMGASRGRQFDQQNILQTLSGQRTPQQNANAAGQNINSMQDVLSYRDNARGAISEMVEANPAIMQGLQVQTVMDQARTVGMNPENMTRGELGQLAGTTGMMTPQEFEAAAAAVESLPETFGRREEERRRTAEARANERFGTGPFERVAEGFRETPAARELVSTSSSFARDTRDAVFSISQGISQSITETFQGGTTVELSGRNIDFFSQENLQNMSAEGRERVGVDEEGNPTGVTATYFEDQNDILAGTEASDVVSQRVRESSEIDPMMVNQSDIDRESRTVRLSPEQIQQQEQRRGVSGLSELGREINSTGTRSYSYSELQEAGLTTVETDSGPTMDEVTRDFLNQGSPGENNAAVQNKLLDTVGSLTGGSTNDAAMLLTPNEFEEVRFQGRASARLVSEARDAAPESPDQLSDQAETVYEKVQSRLFQVERERRMKILNRGGEEGSRQIRNMIRDVGQDAFGISEDLSGSALDKAIREKIQNTEGGMAAFGAALNNFGGAQMAKRIRQSEEYGRITGVGGQPIEDFKDEQATTVDNALNRISNQQGFGEGPTGYFNDSRAAEEIQDGASRSDVMLLAYGKAIGQENLSDAQKDQMQKARARLDSRNVSALGMQTAENISENLGDEGNLSAQMQTAARISRENIAERSGEQEVTTTGVGSFTPDADGELRDEIRGQMSRLAEVIKGLQDAQGTILDRLDVGSQSKGGGEFDAGLRN